MNLFFLYRPFLLYNQRENHTVYYIIHINLRYGNGTVAYNSSNNKILMEICYINGEISFFDIDAQGFGGILSLYDEDLLLLFTAIRPDVIPAQW